MGEIATFFAQKVHNSDTSDESGSIVLLHARQLDTIIQRIFSA